MPSRNLNSYVAQALYASTDLIADDVADGRIIAQRAISDTTMTVGHDLTVTHDVIVHGDFIIDDDITITGDDIVNGDMTAGHLVVTNNASTVILNVTGLLSLPGNRTIAGTTNVNNVLVTNNATVGNDLTITGHLTVDGSQTVTGGIEIVNVNNITVKNDLNVTGNLELDNIISANDELAVSITAGNIVVQDSFSTTSASTGFATRKIVSLQKISVTLTSANIALLEQTGATVCPDLGAAKLGMLRYVILYYKSNGGTYYTLENPNMQLMVSFDNDDNPPADSQFGELIDLDGFIGFNGAPGAIGDSFKILRNPNSCTIPGGSVNDPIATPSLVSVNDRIRIVTTDAGNISGSGGDLTISCWYDVIDFNSI